MKKRTVTPIDKKRESRRGSNQEEENTRRDCYQTENIGGQKHKRKVEQRNMTEEGNIKMGNTFSVLQEDD